VLGGAFLWVLFDGGVMNVPLDERVSIFGLAIVFLLYGFVGERPANFVLKLISGSTSKAQTHEALTDTHEATHETSSPSKD
jgi:hypothetical protein